MDTSTTRQVLHLLGNVGLPFHIHCKKYVWVWRARGAEVCCNAGCGSHEKYTETKHYGFFFGAGLLIPCRPHEMK